MSPDCPSTGRETQPNWDPQYRSTCCTCTYYGGVVHVDYVDSGVHCARGRFTIAEGNGKSCSAYLREPGSDDEGDQPEAWRRVVDYQRQLIQRHKFSMAWARPAYGLWHVTVKQQDFLPGVRPVDDWDELLALYGYV